MTQEAKYHLFIDRDLIRGHNVAWKPKRPELNMIMHSARWCRIRLRKGRAELGIPSNYFQFYQTSKSLWTTTKKQTGVRSSVSVEFLPLGRSHHEWIRNRDFIDTKEHHYLYSDHFFSLSCCSLEQQKKNHSESHLQLPDGFY